MPRCEEEGDLTNCKDELCMICYPDEEFEEETQPLTNHSFDDEGFLR